MISVLESILYDTIYYSTPIVLVALGGLFSYNVNVLNIGLEGMMLMGAFASALFTLLTGNVLIGLIASIFFTLCLGLIFAFLSVNLKSNFIITGFGINILVSAFCAFTLQSMQVPNLNLSRVVNLNSLKWRIPGVQNIPVVGAIVSGHPTITYLTIVLMVIAYIALNKTKFGLYVRVIGENEDAARAVGIHINRIKYAAILIGAVCCALAGTNLSVERMGLFTNDMTAGRGFIALAAFYCGKGKPIPSAVYAVIFGLTQALTTDLGIFTGAVAGLFGAIPYIVMLIVLSVASAAEIKKKRAKAFDLV